MSLDEISVLVSQFARSGWTDLHLRTAGFELFVAKAGGGGNPLLVAMAAEEEALAGRSSIGPPETPLSEAPLAGATAVRATAAEAVRTHVVKAPHVATVNWAAAVGQTVQRGDLVCRLEVLGETLEVRTDAAGRVSSALGLGVLAEYDTPLVEISLPPSNV